MTDFDLPYRVRLKYWGRMEGLSMRIINCLAVGGIESVEDLLLNYNKYDLLRIPNFGHKSLRELYEWIDQNYKPSEAPDPVQIIELTDEQLLHEVARRMRRRFGDA